MNKVTTCKNISLDFRLNFLFKFFEIYLFPISQTSGKTFLPPFLKLQHSFAGTLRLMTSGWKQQTGFCWTLCLMRVLRTRATWLGHQAMSANIVGGLIPDFVFWALLGQVAPKFIRKSWMKKVVSMHTTSDCTLPELTLMLPRADSIEVTPSTATTGRT